MEKELKNWKRKVGKEWGNETEEEKRKLAKEEYLRKRELKETMKEMRKRKEDKKRKRKKKREKKWMNEKKEFVIAMKAKKRWRDGEKLREMKKEKESRWGDGKEERIPSSKGGRCDPHYLPPFQCPTANSHPKECCRKRPSMQNLVYWRENGELNVRKKVSHSPSRLPPSAFR